MGGGETTLAETIANAAGQGSSAGIWDVPAGDMGCGPPTLGEGAAPVMSAGGAPAPTGAPVAQGTGFYDVPGYDPVTGLPTGMSPGMSPADAAAAGAGAANVGAGAAATTGTTALSRVIAALTAGTAPSLDDALTVFGQAAPSVLAMIASGNQADALKGLSEQFAAYGAPSRARYEASFAPGFMPPEVQTSIDAATETGLRKLSASGGNPFGNPSGLAELNRFVTGNVALPAIQQYRNQQAATGGYGAFNAAAPGAAANSIGADSNIWNAAGYGLGQLFNPPQSLSQQIERLLRGSGAPQTPLR